MFMQVFPGAAVWSFLSNLIIVLLTGRSYSSIARRSVSIESDSIGMWQDIFIGISFISTVVNACILAFPSNALQKYYGFESKLTVLAISVLGEHIMIAFKFMLELLIPDTPTTVEKKIRDEEYLRNLINEKQILKLQQKLVKKKEDHKEMLIKTKVTAETAANFNMVRRQSEIGINLNADRKNSDHKAQKPDSSNR